MDNQQLDLDNLTKEDFMEMAKYCHHLEQTNGQLLSQLKECKAGLMATVQQRNSLNLKLQNILLERANTIDVTSIKTEIVTNKELENPEMYRVPEGKVITTPKADRI